MSEAELLKAGASAESIAYILSGPDEYQQAVEMSLTIWKQRLPHLEALLAKARTASTPPADT